MPRKVSAWKVVAILLALIMVSNPELLSLLLTLQALGAEAVLMFLAFQGHEFFRFIHFNIAVRRLPHCLSKCRLKYSGLLILLVFVGGAYVPFVFEFECLSIVLMSAASLSDWSRRIASSMKSA